MIAYAAYATEGNGTSALRLGGPRAPKTRRSARQAKGAGRKTQGNRKEANIPHPNQPKVVAPSFWLLLLMQSRQRPCHSLLWWNCSLEQTGYALGIGSKKRQPWAQDG